uniref:Halobacterial output domain-containing protein n=2 Tax=Haloterrigena alkaliphila TaxID=2816475 RepID=A0A8A2VBY7_9EURY
MSPSDPDFSDDPDAPVRVEHRFDGETPPSIAIVQAIAAIENVDPIASPSDLGITLYDHVDPTALDQIVTGRNGSTSVTIDLTIHNDHEYAVRVQNSGRLIVERSG